MISITKEYLLFLAGLIFPLVFALYSQFFQGFHPCELCIYQRWAFVAAIILFLIKPIRKLSVIAVFIGAAIAFYHVGIEQKWWEGFSTCTADFGKAQTLEGLKAMIEAAPSVRCDEATWFLLGLSMAGWNVIYSLALGIFGYLFLCKQKSI